MQFTFLSAHKVRGIVQTVDTPDLTLFHDTTSGLRVTISGDLNRHWRVLDRQLALASMLLRGLVGQPLGGEFHDNLSAQVEAVRKHRAESLGSDGVVVVEVRGDVEASLPPSAREIDDYILCFDAFDKKALRAGLWPQVSAVLTALRIGASGRYEFEAVANGSYLTTNDGKIVHSLSAELGLP